MKSAQSTDKMLYKQYKSKDSKYVPNTEYDDSLDFDETDLNEMDEGMNGKLLNQMYMSKNNSSSVIRN